MGTGRRVKVIRWLCLVLFAIAAGLLIALLMIVPAMGLKVPGLFRDYSNEWLALALAAAFKGAQALLAVRSPDDPAARRTRWFLDLVDLGSRRALAGGLVIVLSFVIAAMMATWLPHYLTWPWCRDEDTFATLALSWENGIRPYRDIPAYNFPGHIYLHWLIGKVFGWGRTVPFYALDAAAVLLLGVALTIWSRRRLGGSLPGLVAYAAFLDFYLSLEYHSVAERDWHATLAPVLAIMALEVWPGRISIWAAAMLQATALTVRPHAVFFLPAMVSAIAERPARGRALAEWLIALVLFTGLGFAPLVAQGLLDDLVRGLNVVAYGGPYSHASLAGFLEIVNRELHEGWTFALIIALIVLWRFDNQLDRKLTGTWLLALVAAFFYRTVHPIQHGYLVHPLALIGSIALALPTARVLSTSALSGPLRLLVLLLIVAEAVPHIPSFCYVSDSIRAVRSLARGVEPTDPPPGCRIRWFDPGGCAYDWKDYCLALEYLRRTTGANTEVANFLRQPPFPSFNGPVGRLSPFRAESGICWMWLIDMDLDIPFAESLERTPDSVVVWSPQEQDSLSSLRLEHVTRVIRQYYHPEARFGPIEVWRRSPVSAQAVAGVLKERFLSKVAFPPVPLHIFPPLRRGVGGGGWAGRHRSLGTRGTGHQDSTRLQRLPKKTGSESEKTSRTRRLVLPRPPPAPPLQGGERWLAASAQQIGYPEAIASAAVLIAYLRGRTELEFSY